MRQPLASPGRAAPVTRWWLERRRAEEASPWGRAAPVTRWWLERRRAEEASPWLHTLLSSSFAVKGVKEITCWLSVQGAGGKLLYLLPRGGKSGSCPLGPENSRHVGGSEKEIKRPRGGTLHRPRGWPSSSSLAETAALSLEVSSDLVCPDCKEAVSPHRSGICSFLQAGPFHGMTQPHFSRAGQERPWVKEI